MHASTGRVTFGLDSRVKFTGVEDLRIRVQDAGLRD